MLDLAIYGISALIGIYLLLIIFRQAKENEQLRHDVEDLIDAANAHHLADANGTVSRGARGRFVSTKAKAA